MTRGGLMATRHGGIRLGMDLSRSATGRNSVSDQQLTVSIGLRLTRLTDRAIGPSRSR